MRQLLPLIVFFMVGIHQQAQAKDTRLAVLVANQQGWDKEPRLRYAISGDLQPLANLLRKVGFTVKLLKNQNANSIRKMMKWVNTRTKQAPHIKTFLLYYSGHADKTFLHTGPRTKHPIRYATLATFLHKLPVKRRFAIFDACFSGEVIRQFGTFRRYRKFVRKGIRSVKPIDLSKTFQHKHEQRGLQIISSGLHYAWESLEHRASIFTYFLLQGLKGRADRDADGKISMNEVFNYIRQQMSKSVKQTPQFFGVVQRSDTYAIAPAYHSRLRISAALQGTLRIQVANFYWLYQKKHRRPLRLSLVHGKGYVELQKGKVCLRQNIYAPKGREIVLRASGWKPFPCKQMRAIAKGSLLLKAQPYVPPAKSKEWSLFVAGGTMYSQITGQPWLVGGSLGLQQKWFVLRFSAWGTNSSFGKELLPQMLLQLDAAFGYTLRTQRWSLFGGVYAGYTMFFQDLGQQMRVGSLFAYGALLTPGVEMGRHWRWTLPIRAGFYVGELGGQLSHVFHFSAQLALQFHI